LNRAWPELRFQNATVGTFTNGLDRLVAGLSSQLSPTFGPTDTDGFIDLSFAGSDIFYPFDIVDPSIPSNGELIDDFFDPQVVGTLDVLELQINATYRVNSSELIVDAEKVIANFREDGRLPLAEVPGIFELPDSATSLNEPIRVEVGESSFGRATDWVFDNFDLSNKIVFDPDVAVGYEYELQNPEAGQSFATFLAPQIGGDDEYLISIFDLDSGEFGDAFLLSANTEFNFSQFDSDVTRFIIMGIDEPLDPKDQTAFPALISFNGDGLGSLRQSALVSASAIPEPSSGVGWIVALFALAVRRNRRGEPKGG
jgi:hypothetical protein